MSETTLIKVEAEVEKLTKELKSLQEAAMYSVALSQLLSYVCETPEPFSGSPPESNPWHAAAGGGPSCCVVS
jgi:hypothetical protein|eukprot:17649-Heterococcus_DN1.PRE.1